MISERGGLNEAGRGGEAGKDIPRVVEVTPRSPDGGRYAGRTGSDDAEMDSALDRACAVLSKRAFEWAFHRSPSFWIVSSSARYILCRERAMGDMEEIRNVNISSTSFTTLEESSVGVVCLC